MSAVRGKGGAPLGGLAPVAGSANTQQAKKLVIKPLKGAVRGPSCCIWCALPENYGVGVVEKVLWLARSRVCAHPCLPLGAAQSSPSSPPTSRSRHGASCAIASLRCIANAPCPTAWRSCTRWEVRPADRALF